MNCWFSMNMNETLRSGLIYLVISVLFVWMVVKKLPNMDTTFTGRSPNQTSKQVCVHNSVQLNSTVFNNFADIQFFRFISTIHCVCKESLRLENGLDGGWNMCIDGNFHPTKTCLVYSFGINYDFSFDDAVSRRFGCTVRSFDPSMEKVSNHRRGKHVWFYKYGLGISNRTYHISKSDWTMKSLSAFLKEFNETGTTMDYLKMDIEGSEWGALKTMLSSQVLGSVKQLGIEIHVDKDSNSRQLTEFYDTLKGLEQRGFRRWYFSLNMYGLIKHENGFRSCCYEMVYINTNFVDSHLGI